VQINFKDALVAELKENFPDLLKEIWLQDSKEWRSGITPADRDYLFRDKPPLVRTLMQNYGTDVRRKEDPCYWTDRWIDATEWDLMKNKTVLTDDVRFLNEAEAIRLGKGILIRLERTDISQEDQHLSETEQQQIECDYTISVGQGELDKLEEELIKIIK